MAKVLEIGKNKLNFSKRTLIMGVLNITPDSFSDGGRFIKAEAAKQRAIVMQEEGADIIDVGGESSRPGSEKVSEEQELGRVLPVLKAIKDEVSVPISIDSYKPNVIEKALENGASIINDITGLQNKKIREIAVEGQFPVIIMHMQGTPQHMQESPTYDDVVKDIYKFFEKQTSLVIKEGLNRSKIVIDPGIGFGKTLEHNLEILRRFEEFRMLGFPTLVGTSRKSFIGALSGAEVDKRLPGTVASISAAVLKGANIVRVHDVAEAKQAIQVVDAIEGYDG
ncbi:MAG: dihydropteroate synthase [Actinobacteria bacterium]|nr:MAG: dihydropteroate synthase [Actinomycetota bacterium]